MSVGLKREPSRGINNRRSLKRRAIAFETLESRAMLTSVPYGAADQDLAEFMLGKVAVTVVFFESVGAIAPGFDVSTEDWTPELITETKGKIADGLQWWVDTLAGQNSVHSLEFDVDWQHADNPIATLEEPINRRSDEFTKWGSRFFAAVGFEDASEFTIVEDLETFNHQQRVARDANWAFTIFVANSENDPNDSWNGGSFGRAFALPQEKLIVVPSGRPAATTAHEVGHMFWALDEYQGGGSYAKTRGVYNTQNTNAWDNPDPTYERVPSIMDRSAGVEGTLLELAYDSHTSSPSSLEMVGWRDSDGDGVFDILDVPHTLQGSGYYDANNGRYVFAGSARVGVLPNLNPRPGESTAAGSQRNDITINTITHVEYRIDGGAWQRLEQQYNSYHADLQLAIPVPDDFSQIELRAVDAATRRIDPDTGIPDVDTGVTSNVFAGSRISPTSTAESGISGFVRYDSSEDGTLDATETAGLAGWTVRLVDANGSQLDLTDGVEPDDFASDATLLNTQNAAVALSAVGSAVANDSVASRVRSGASTGDRVFAHFVTATSASTEWTQDDRQLRMDFAVPIATISLDAVANSNNDYGRLEIYDSSDRLLGRYTTQTLGQGASETMQLSRSEGDIAYAVASGHMGATIRFDNLSFGPLSEAITDTAGAYSLPYLPDGSYIVELLDQQGFQVTTAATQQVDVAGMVSNIDFGVTSDSVVAWTNPVAQYDVDSSGAVELQDALYIVNDLYTAGERDLPQLNLETPTRYLDANADNRVSLADALAVINAIYGEQSAAAAGEFAADELSPTRTGTTQIPQEGESASHDSISQHAQSVDAVWGVIGDRQIEQFSRRRDAVMVVLPAPSEHVEALADILDEFSRPVRKLWHTSRLWLD